MAKNQFFDRIISRIKRGIKLLREGHARVVWKELRKRLYSQSLSFGLRRDLDEEFLKPDASIKISIRYLREKDIPYFMEHGELAKKNPKLAAYQLSMIRSRIPTCYVAVTEDDEPCYMQWLIVSENNPELHDHFGNVFPPLDDDEALLEAAFMRRSFRGLNVMPAAMARIAEKGKELGARRTLTFVGANNIPALKGCHRAGFSPYILRKERWIMFMQLISFDAIPKYLLNRYEQITADQPEYPDKETDGQVKRENEMAGTNRKKQLQEKSFESHKWLE